MGSRYSTFLDHLRRPGEGEFEHHHRRVLFPVYVGSLVAAAFSVLWKPNSGVYSVGLVVACASLVLGVATMLLRVPISSASVFSPLALVIAAALLMLDASIASELGERVWPISVLLMDTLLILDANLMYQKVLMTMIVLGTAVVAAESAWRFGLYDLVDRDPGVKFCSCPSPPCKKDMTGAFFTWFVVIFIFIVDYRVTRAFAEGLRKQLQVIQSTVVVSERLAYLLASYATDDARRIVAEEGAALPESLRMSYQQLLANLDSYRVFLPDSLLYVAQQKQEQEQLDGLHQGREPTTASSASGAVVRIRGCASLRSTSLRTPPGLGDANATVAICFTDIQSSTELWEAHPQSMFEGLDTHNAIMRHTYNACNGYEVKTIGDAFMVAFDTAVDALTFGLEAQKGLLAAQWPDDLLTHHLCKPLFTAEGGLLWGGLRVRIGAHHGPVRVVSNPVTRRYDYFGPTVNVAARLEAVLRKGGLVATSDSVVSAVGSSGLALLGSPEMRDAGARQLKGVKEPVTVWALVPQSLKGRLSVLTDSDGPAPSTPPSRSVGVSRGRSLVQSNTELVRNASQTSSSGRTVGERHSSVLGMPGGLMCLKASSDITLRPRPKPAACAVVRAQLHRMGAVSDCINSFVSAAALAADRMRGVVECVLSGSVVVTWNAGRPCSEYVAAGYQFLRSSFRTHCHLGAASGEVLTGAVGAGRRSFTVVVGGCVDLAAGLAEEAERCGDAVLAAGAVAEHGTTLGAAHWAQLWQAAGCPGTVVKAIDVDGQVGDSLDWAGNLYDEGKGDWQDAVPEHGDISALFFRACAVAPGSDEQQVILTELRQLDCAAQSTRTRVEAQVLAGRIAENKVRTRPMPPLWDAGGERSERELLSSFASRSVVSPACRTESVSGTLVRPSPSLPLLPL